MKETPDRTRARRMLPGPLKVRRFKGGHNIYVSAGPYRDSNGVFLRYAGNGYAWIALDGIGETEINMDAIHLAESNPLREAPHGDAVLDELFGYHGAHTGMLE